MSVIIKPEYVAEVLDRLCGSDLSGAVPGPGTTVGPQDAMYKFFDLDRMTKEEIAELERHRT